MESTNGCESLKETKRIIAAVFAVICSWLGWLTMDHLSLKYDNAKLLTEVKSLSEFTAKTVDELKQEFKQLKK